MNLDILQQKYRNACDLFSQAQYDKAFCILKELLNVYPSQYQCLGLISHIFIIQGKLFKAEKYLFKLIEVSPTYAHGYYLFGVLKEKQGDFLQAAYYLNLAIDISPNRQYYLHLIELTQSFANSQEDFLKLLRILDRYLRAFPKCDIGYFKRSNVLQYLGLYQLSLQDINTSLSLNPSIPIVWCSKAFLLNSLGKYEEGWQCYEWRLKTDKILKYQKTHWTLPIPRWQGENLGNGILLIYAEQGLGDNIQFFRYVLEAKKRGLNILSANFTPVESLLNYNLSRNGIPIIRNGENVMGKNVKYYVPLMSLPLHFKTTIETIPNRTQYLEAQPEFIQKWQETISSKRPKVGIVWSGSKTNGRDKERSLSFESISSLLSMFTEVEFHCLQKVVDDADKQDAKSYNNIYFWDTQIEDFSDTAGIMAHLDLVISVDTSVVHLAGAMGKTVWVLVHYVPDFRWLLDRDDSPWYEHVRIFRQNESLSWNEVLVNVQKDLQLWLREQLNNLK